MGSKIMLQERRNSWLYYWIALLVTDRKPAAGKTRFLRSGNFLVPTSRQFRGFSSFLGFVLRAVFGRQNGFFCDLGLFNSFLTV